MSGKNIISNDKKINKSNFYKNKTLFSIYDIDVDKLLISKKERYGKKKAHLNTLLDIMMISRPLCIKLPQIIGFTEHFDSKKNLIMNLFMVIMINT